MLPLHDTYELYCSTESCDSGTPDKPHPPHSDTLKFQTHGQKLLQSSANGSVGWIKLDRRDSWRGVVEYVDVDHFDFDVSSVVHVHEDYLIAFGKEQGLG